MEGLEEMLFVGVGESEVLLVGAGLTEVEVVGVGETEVLEVGIGERLCDTLAVGEELGLGAGVRLTEMLTDGVGVGVALFEGIAFFGIFFWRKCDFDTLLANENNLSESCGEDASLESDSFNAALDE